MASQSNNDWGEISVSIYHVQPAGAELLQGISRLESEDERIKKRASDDGATN